ncbi:unnamed protein product, partial [Callosobruchus maculatus]
MTMEELTKQFKILTFCSEKNGRTRKQGGKFWFYIGANVK